MGIDEVVEQGPLQPCAHAGVHPEAGARQLGAPVIVDEAQVGAQVHMVLGLKVEGVLLAHIAQGLIVLLAAGEQVGVGEVGQAQHGGLEFHLELCQLCQFVSHVLVQLHGLGVVFRDGRVDGGGVLAPLLRALLLAEELAVFLAQLVLLGGFALGGGLQSPDPLVQNENLVYGGVAVHFLGLEARLDCVGVFLDFLNIQHFHYLFFFDGGYELTIDN